MAKAKTPWIFEKSDRGGIWVGWYDALGKRHNKKFANKSLATQQVARLTLELNDQSRPIGSAIPISWDDLLDQYRQFLRFKGRTESTITRRFLTLNKFTETMKITAPKQVTQKLIQDYIVKARSRKSRFERPLSAATVYAEIAILRAFVNWATDEDHPYIVGRFKLKQGPADQWRKPIALKDEQVGKLLAVLNDDKVVAYPDAWRTRILLAAATGLRRGDIERLRPSDFDPDDMTVRTQERKTRKWTKRPIPEAAWGVIWPYVSSLDPNAMRLFPDSFESKKWDRIREAAGLPVPGFRFHDLRVLFTSALAKGFVPTGIAQKLLNHATPNLTNSVYTDLDPTLRPAVEKIPVGTWLKKAQSQTAQAASEAAKPEGQMEKKEAA
jgi:integrase